MAYLKNTTLYLGYPNVGIIRIWLYGSKSNFLSACYSSPSVFTATNYNVILLFRQDILSQTLVTKTNLNLSTLTGLTEKLHIGVVLGYNMLNNRKSKPGTAGKL